VTLGENLGSGANAVAVRLVRFRRTCRRAFAPRGRSTSASHQVVLEDRLNRPHAIFPTDFLALRISPAAVRNAYLVDSTAPSGNFGDNFGFNSETIFFYPNRFDKGSFERLVAGFYVRQIKVGAHVGKQRQKPVADHVPEKKDAMRSPAHEAGAEDRVRFV